MIKLNEKWTDPLRPESVFTGSAYTAAVERVPDDIDGYRVTGVFVSVTNADGIAAVVPCRRRTNGIWSCTFAASNFANYGFVSKGLKVELVGVDEDGNEQRWTRGVGDFEVVAGTASAVPGDPSSGAVTKGSDVYVRSRLVAGVQHFVRQVMYYDDEQSAWVADWQGDYILAGGEFIPANGGNT